MISKNKGGNLEKSFSTLHFIVHHLPKKTVIKINNVEIKLNVSLCFIVICAALVSSCNKCDDTLEDQNPPRLVQLKSDVNQDLWFGAAAIFNPDSVLFIHETAGALPFTVNNQKRAIALVFPETAGASQKITLRLSQGDSDQIDYSTESEENECTTEEILRYVNFEGVRACTNCGDGRFNSSAFIVLRKAL